MSAHEDLPSDCEPLPGDVREAFANLVEARARFYGSKVTDLAEYRRTKAREELAQAQLGHDLANAFRSTEAAGKYDDEGDGK